MAVVSFAFSFLAREQERRKGNVHLAYSFLLAGAGAAFAIVLTHFNRYMPLMVLLLVGMAWAYNRLVQRLVQMQELLKEHQIPTPADPQL